MTETYKDWHEKLPFTLFAYRTSIRTSTGATPFSLVYGMEAILPIEVEIPSLLVLSELKLDEVEWIQSRYDQLNLIEEKRGIPRRRLGTEENSPHTKRLLRKVDVKLGRTLCGKESLFWRNVDFDRDGWKEHA
ncbi:uncharacterized protein LOC128043031 [Gossypium raimondii]|uniref:uncharacterized protein LOC128043031 n=1 Tax=Gossypium raimondii TaxID=29730 RepID=UPI00227BC3DD|nr:uncharacterized protein LOC128043031 [Gossypium raimondii]